MEENQIKDKNSTGVKMPVMRRAFSKIDLEKLERYHYLKHKSYNGGITDIEFEELDKIEYEEFDKIMKR